MKTVERKRLPAASPSPALEATEAVADLERPVARPVTGGTAFPTGTGSSGGQGLPEQLQAAVEQMSRLAMDDVTVHYGSALPAQLGAHAFTQGREIHLAPGQEKHLPHEAWHVVQQAQGRVTPTSQSDGHQAVNDDHQLEHEADRMGARALKWTPTPAGALTREQLGAPRPASGVAPIQLVKIVVSKGVLSVKDDKEPLKKGKGANKERLATDEQILAYRGDNQVILQKQQELRAAASAERKRVREQRRATQVPRRMPAARQGKQVEFPEVLEDQTGKTATLVYRGMSVNNINNLKKNRAAVFTAQNPTGSATPVEHIVDDSPNSPYLSFEARGLGISVGKYAHKPVDEHNKPLGVDVTPDTGFLKQEKSYTDESQRRHGNGKRIGYVGGVPSSPDHLDVSDRASATSALRPSQGEKNKTAVELAVADREVLVRPGPGGIGAAFVAKVKVVDEAYFKKNLIHQQPTKALGFFKKFDGPPVFCKIQVLKGDYRFRVPEELERNDEDSEAEMSDVEDMDMSAYD